MAGRYDGPDVQTSVDIGDVNLLNAAGTKINPATEGTLDAMSSKIDDLIDVTLADVTQAASTAYVAADKVMPSGAVVKTTRAVSEVSIIDGDWTPLQTTINGDLRTRDDDLITALTPYTNVISAALTLAGSAELLIKAYNSGTTYTTGQVCSSSGVIYTALQEATNKTPASEPTYWRAVTVRAILFSAPSTNANDVTWGSANHRGQTLAAGGTAIKISVSSAGALSLYVIGTATDVVNYVLYE